ncbi:helix-turn-helix domain-containing protein [Mycoplasmopsis bovigenitalium]|uniref:helix-turn-helix domain-containing protein n=1 Tax=Mycoplasmopsis bovigenitalium TaxID=2112 RepID=UPI000BBA474A|nr:helix-turn-helix domain-containing protein [Mycoplasmopsis bovigenitalium]
MKTEITDKWISTDEAAEYLGVKATTIREWIKKDNGIPAHKIGRLWKLKKEELDEWVKSGKVLSEM